MGSASLGRRRRRLRDTTLLSMLVATACLFTAGAVVADGTPTLATDKADYAPGETATLTGAGWEPGESVTLVVRGSDGYLYDEAALDADGSGAFAYDFALPQAYVESYTAEAAGSSGARVSTTFTDSNISLSPASTTVSVAAGSTTSVSITATKLAAGPPGNPSIDSLQVPGGTPNLCFGNSGLAMPSSWLSVTSPALPATLSGSSQVVAIAVSPPSATAAANYRARISFSTTNGSANVVQLCVTVIADTSAPAGSVTINGGTAATNTTSATLQLQATDAVGVTAYRVANGSDCSGATYVSVTPTTSLSTSIGHTLTSVEGAKTVCAQYRDAAGNESATVTDTIVLDTAKPTITAAATKADATAYSAGTWTNQSVTVAFSCADNVGGSGLATANPIPGGGTQSTDTATGSFTSGVCLDNAGNAADVVTFGPIKIDTTAPVITGSGTKADSTAYLADTWTNQTVTVLFTCSETGAVQSGVATANPVGGGGTQSAETAGVSFTSTGACTDNAGNSGGAAIFGPVRIDKTKPTLAAAATSPPGGAAYIPNSWTNDDVEVTFDCQDALSGVATDSVPDVTVTDEGANQSVTSSGNCTDAAGNEAVAASFANIDIDKTAPTLVASAASPPGGGAYTGGTWTNKAVKVAFACADLLSGVATDTVPDATLAAEGRDQSVTSTGDCIDNAGNEANAVTFGDIDIDLSPPNAPSLVTTPVLPPYAGGGGWFKDTVTVTVVSNGDPDLADSNPGSGVDPASVSAPTAYSTSGSHTKTATVKDFADNTSPSASLTVQVDTKLPTFGACVGGPFLLASGMQTVSITAADTGESGVDGAASTLSGLVDTSTIGTKSVLYTAVDNVGHSATKTCSYGVIFDFHGFFQPVDNGGVYNVVTAGRAIPLKFDLSGNQGLEIFSPDFPASTAVSCNGAAGTDLLEETLTAGSSSLIYTEGQPYGQYHYVWKTDKAWANTCRRLDLKLVDGTTHSAYFKFAR